MPALDRKLPTLLGLFLAALAVRVLVVFVSPTPFSWDGYERWAGRQHLLVHDWLPLPQGVVFVVGALGGGTLAMRLAFAVVGAAAATLGGLVAWNLGGRTAAALFLVASSFPPFLAYSTVAYQEGPYLLSVFAVLALASERRWLLADIVAGTLALVRYEGWAVLLAYLAVRRDPRALVATWGPALWVFLKLRGVEGAHPSPTDLADWEGLGERFEWPTYLSDLGGLASKAWSDGLAFVALFAVPGVYHAWRARKDVTGLALSALLLQVAAVLGWMAGLEGANHRMLATLGVLAGLFAAVGLARMRDRLSRPTLVLAIAGTLALAAFTWAGAQIALTSVRAVRWEVDLAREVESCEGCRFWIVPRRGLGSRERHDGCAALQGLTELLEGRDFACEGWPGADKANATRQAVWTGERYRVEPITP